MIPKYLEYLANMLELEHDRNWVPPDRVPRKLQLEVRARLEDLATRYQPNLKPKMKLKWFIRPTESIGVTMLREDRDWYTIAFNPPYFIAYPECIETTVKHEFAHLVRYERYGPTRENGGHDKLWYAIMNELGVWNPSPGHSKDFPGVEVLSRAMAEQSIG